MTVLNAASPVVRRRFQDGQPPEAEAAMVFLDCEQCVSRTLRRILADLPIGASLYDLERPQPEQSGALFPCLEYFLPDVLAEVHPEWRKESFDGFLPVFARKVGLREAELFGLSITISDQASTPFHLKLQIASDVDEVSWLEFRVGEKGDGGKRLSSIASYKSSSALYNRLYAFQEQPHQMDWAYEITFGNRDP